MTSYQVRYGESMDYVREKFKLPVSVSMYEAVVTVTEAYRKLVGLNELKSLNTGETTNVKRKPGRPRKASRSN